MVGYTNLFREILTSSIWDESDETRLVWITLIALKGRDHVARVSLASLARLARVPLEAARLAMEKFLDEYPYEGRRIERVEGGWLIFNGEIYGRKMEQDEKREYNRVSQAKHRAKIKAAKIPQEV
jgi:hypothetical protein